MTYQPPFQIPQPTAQVSSTHQQPTTLKVWQEQLRDLASIYEPRKIYYVYDPQENIDRNTFTRWMMTNKLGQIIPFFNNFRKMMGEVMKLPISTCYMIDISRTNSRQKLDEFWSGIETLKDGYTFDTRYKFQQKYFDPPVVIIFSNELPDRTMLTDDKWAIYTVLADEKLSLIPRENFSPERVFTDSRPVELEIC